MDIKIEVNLWNTTKQKFQCFRHAVKSTLGGDDVEIILRNYKVAENGCEFDCKREKE